MQGDKSGGHPMSPRNDTICAGKCSLRTASDRWDVQWERAVEITHVLVHTDWTNLTI